MLQIHHYAHFTSYACHTHICITVACTVLVSVVNGLIMWQMWKPTFIDDVAFFHKLVLLAPVRQPHDVLNWVQHLHVWVFRHVPLNRVQQTHQVFVRVCHELDSTQTCLFKNTFGDSWREISLCKLHALPDTQPTVLKLWRQFWIFNNHTLTALQSNSMSSTFVSKLRSQCNN